MTQSIKTTMEPSQKQMNDNVYKLMEKFANNPSNRNRYFESMLEVIQAAKEEGVRKGKRDAHKGNCQVFGNDKNYSSKRGY